MGRQWRDALLALLLLLSGPGLRDGEEEKLADSETLIQSDQEKKKQSTRTRASTSSDSEKVERVVWAPEKVWTLHQKLSIESF